MQICNSQGCDNTTRKRSFSATSRSGEGKAYYMKKCNRCANNIKRFGMTTPERMAVPAHLRPKIINSKKAKT